MTVSTAPYFSWSGSGIDSTVAPYNSCSPNLVSLQDYYRRRWGAVSLGCHNQRPVSGGSTLSSHAWGAACDPRFPDRTATVQAMEWTIAFSAELGVNTIHDYIRQMMWKPGQGWVSASIGSVGGQWIHVETTPAAFGDGRPVEDKLPGTIQEDPFMTPEDQKYLDAKFAALVKEVWENYGLTGLLPPPGVYPTGATLRDTRLVLGEVQNAVQALAQKVDNLAISAGDAEAIQAAIREIVREELDNTRLGLAG